MAFGTNKQSINTNLAAMSPSPDNIQSVTILGATGTIGRAALDLIAQQPDRFFIDTLTAHSNIDDLAQLAVKHRAKRAIIADDKHTERLKQRLEGTGIYADGGGTAMAGAAETNCDLVISAIVGIAGLTPTWNALRWGHKVALANKESLVSAGHLMMAEAQKANATILPVDSEHNAIFQCLESENRQNITKLILTASGGPLRKASHETMAKMTPEQAIKHPNWSMGAKISVDSATMMNKGLEIIEAHILFAMPENMIEVVVHPESIIHALVAYSDGSMLAQLGCPDMRIPLAHVLAWPKRLNTHVKHLDLLEVGKLHFYAPDTQKFPALSMARNALRLGQSYPAALNAANEVAVAAFLKKEIAFLDIEKVVSQTLEAHKPYHLQGLDDVFEADASARSHAKNYINAITNR